MRFVKTAIEGAWFVETERIADARGAFMRTYCRDAFRAAGVQFEPTQSSLSTNPIAATLRGLHYQQPPYAESKLILCAGGSVFDVAVDLRRSSSSFGRVVSAELSASGARLFYIPPGCAHGFLTLEPNSSLCYLMDTPFEADAAAGIRWNDPALGIDWPAPPKMISERDAAFADFDPAVQGLP